MREALITFLFALVIGAMINGSNGPAISHAPNTLQQETPTEDSSLVSAVTQAGFDSEVLQSENPVLVEFWATWCGPCKRMKPVVDEIAKEFEGKLKTVKVDIDAEPELASKFNVNGVPTLVLFKDGRVVTTLSGVIAKESLAEQINHVL
ncbi:MAG: thioredoxin [Candidatus Obscuribacterales bacterium]|nr:thioredoxin [Candidatus Obscuribacterales bacterium]